MATHILAEPIELLESTLNSEARTVDVILIKPGWSANGRYYSRDVLVKAAPLFEGVKAYANHPTREQLKRGEGRSVLDITGDYTNVRIGEAGELRATRHVYGSAGDAVWPLIERAVETKRPIIGVSINALGKATKGKGPDGQEGVIVESIDRANSADDVDTPAAGGGFENLLMGSDHTLVHDLLQALSYEEFIEARPDYIETVRKQLKRARQDDTVRALTSERDAAQTALTEAQRDTVQLTSDLTAARADNARLLAMIEFERSLKEARFDATLEHELREQIERAPVSEWLAILDRQRRTVAALKLGKKPVTVTGAPLRTSAPVTLNESHGRVLNAEAIKTPDDLVRVLQEQRSN